MNCGGWGIYCPYCRTHGSVIVVLSCQSCGAMTGGTQPIWTPPQFPPPTPEQHVAMREAVQLYHDGNSGGRTTEETRRSFVDVVRTDAVEAQRPCVLQGAGEKKEEKPACGSCAHREKLAVGMKYQRGGRNTRGGL